MRELARQVLATTIVGLIGGFAFPPVGFIGALLAWSHDTELAGAVFAGAVAAALGILAGLVGKGYAGLAGLLGGAAAASVVWMAWSLRGGAEFAEVVLVAFLLWPIGAMLGTYGLTLAARTHWTGSGNTSPGTGAEIPGQVGRPE